MLISDNGNQVVAGAKVKATSFDRPTLLSVQMAKAGIIPDVHLVRDLAATARVRHRNDTHNLRKSAYVAF